MMLPMIRRNWLAPTFEPFGHFQNDVDSLLSRVFGNDGAFQTQTWSGVPVAVWEDEGHVWVEVEAPGALESDIDVSFHDGMLFIRGETKAPENRSYLYNSRSFGKFERVIALPSSVDTENIKATLSHGILQIEMSKAPEARPRKIEVTTGQTA
jgi:HSP20 family protein